MKQIVLFFSFLVYTTQASPPYGRIYGGSEASPAQFPFVAALNGDQRFCMGAIINKNWILTSALCLTFASPNSTVHVGTNVNPYGGANYTILSTIPHEDFDIATFANNIALIQIDGEFEYSDTLQPIEIGDVDANATCFSMGWGSTPEVEFPPRLLYIDVVTLSAEECQSRNYPGNYLDVGEEQVCAFGGEGKGFCIGDLGGPLVCDGKLVGVASYPMWPCGMGYPDVYARAGLYRDWINQHVT